MVVAAPRGHRHAFTLIELLVVMAIIAVLLTLVTPRFIGGTDRAKEAVLRQNLVLLREAIDKHFGDTGRYPATLQDLVTAHYLRSVPVDPVTERDSSWVTIPPADASMGGVFDVRSGAQGTARNGTPYGEL